MKVANEHGIESKDMGQITHEPGIWIRDKGVNVRKYNDLLFK
jgi:hypothetical protein